MTLSKLLRLVLCFLFVAVVAMLYVHRYGMPQTPGARTALENSVVPSVIVLLFTALLYSFVEAAVMSSMHAEAAAHVAARDAQLYRQFAVLTVPAYTAQMAQGRKKFIKWWTPRYEASRGRAENADRQVSNPNGLSD